MSEAIAFLIGFFAMVFLWGDVDYFSHDSAYRRGYRKAIEDIAKAEADAARKDGENHDES